MILNGKTIERLLKKNELIENATLDNIESSAYDLTMSNKILKFKKKGKVSLIDAAKLNDMYEEVLVEGTYELKPGETIILGLEEKFNMPKDVSGVIRGRTSFNRLGIFISSQHIHPYYKGVLNLTITNNSPNTYELMPKMKVAQVVFSQVDKSVDKQFIEKRNNSSYQNGDGMQGSFIYKDFIGKVVKHYKGNYYYIENICMNSETTEYMVIYRSLYDNELSKVWTRPAKMFFEEIDENMKSNMTGQKHRFEIVDDLSYDYTKNKD